MLNQVINAQNQNLATFNNFPNEIKQLIVNELFNGRQYLKIFDLENILKVYSVNKELADNLGEFIKKNKVILTETEFLKVKDNLLALGINSFNELKIIIKSEKFSFEIFKGFKIKDFSISNYNNNDSLEIDFAGIEKIARELKSLKIDLLKNSEQNVIISNTHKLKSLAIRLQEVYLYDYNNKLSQTIGYFKNIKKLGLVFNFNADELFIDGDVIKILQKIESLKLQSKNKINAVVSQEITEALSKNNNLKEILLHNLTLDNLSHLPKNLKVIGSGSMGMDTASLEKFNDLEKLFIYGENINLFELTTHFSKKIDKYAGNIKFGDKLKEFTLQNYTGNNLDFRFFKHCPNIQSLTLSNLANIENDSNLSLINTLKNLKSLDLSGSDLVKLENIKGCNNLEYLDLSNISTIEDYEVLNKFTNLKTLDLSDSNFNDFDNIKNCNQITTLNIQGLGNITNAAALSNLRNLNLIKIEKFTQENELKQIEFSTTIVRLMNARSDKLIIKHFDVKGYKKVSDIRILFNIANSLINKMINKQNFQEFLNVPDDKYFLSYLKETFSCKQYNENALRAVLNTSGQKDLFDKKQFLRSKITNVNSDDINNALYFIGFAIYKNLISLENAKKYINEEYIEKLECIIKTLNLTKENLNLAEHDVKNIAFKMQRKITSENNAKRKVVNSINTETIERMGIVPNFSDSLNSSFSDSSPEKKFRSRSHSFSNQVNNRGVVRKLSFLEEDGNELEQAGSPKKAKTFGEFNNNSPRK